MLLLDTSLYFDIFTIYGIIALIMSIFLIKTSMDDNKKKMNLKDLFFFMTVYIFLFPLVSLYSIYKFVKKERGWFTK